MKRKNLFLCTAAILLAACAGQPEPTKTPEPALDIPEETEVPEETAVSVEVWNVDPVFEYEDIDTSFASQDHVNSAESDDNYLNLALIYPMRDIYNSDHLLGFTGSFEKGGLFVYKYGRFGVMDGNGNVTFEPQYDSYTIQSGMLINNSITMACQIKYDYTYDYCTDAWGIGGAYRHLGSMTESAMVVDTYRNKLISVYDLHADAVKAGLITEDDYFIYNAQVWDDPQNYIEGYVLVGNDSYIQLTEGFDKKLIAFSDDTVLLAAEDASFERSDFEFMDLNGNILGFGYEDAYGFFEGYAPVKKDGKWGYIDKNGRCITGYIFDKATPLCDGKAWVIYHGRTGRLNLISMIENKVPFDDSVLSIDSYEPQDPTHWIEIIVRSINVRNRPSKSGEKITSIGYGQIVPYISKQENEGYTWYQLNADRWIADQDGEWIAER